MKAQFISEKQSEAIAIINGSNSFPNIKGIVKFKQMYEGVLITAKIYNLPISNSEIYGFHIHEGNSCTGNASDPFADAKMHYNPKNSAHPLHSGDLPPLLGNNGTAYMSVLTDRFTLDEIIGRTIIIHELPDDFKTQPSGDSGIKIACGVIKMYCL